MGSIGKICWVHGDEEDGVAFACPNGHGLCAECLLHMVAEAIPQVCLHPNCGAHIDHVAMRKCVPVGQHSIFDEKMLAGIQRAAPLDGEKTRKCPQCKVYMEVDAESACGDFQCRHEYIFQRICHFNQRVSCAIKLLFICFRFCLCVCLKVLLQVC